MSNHAHSKTRDQKVLRVAKSFGSLLLMLLALGCMIGFVWFLWTT
jgi:hypothetical protein